MAAGNTILANTTAINNVEVYVSNTAFVVANTVANGSAYLITMGGANYTAGEKIGTIAYKLKFGGNGTITDATVCTVLSSRDVGDTTPLAAQFLVTVRGNFAGIGSTAVLAVTGYELGTNKGAVNSVIQSITGITTTNNWVLGTSFAGGDGVSNVVFSTASVQTIAA